MKELDILLERFIDNHEQDLEKGTWPELESLLNTEDDLLWDWFMDPHKPSASRYRNLLDHIRNGAA